MADNRLSTFLPDDKAAFGVFPQMKPRRRLQDPAGAANVPLDVTRGRVAGLAGLLPDVLNFMGRSPMPTEQFGETQYEPAQQLPYGSEYFLQNLPLKPTSRIGEVAGQAGAFVPLNPMPVARAAAVGVKALGPTAGRMAEGYLQRTGGILPLDVYQGSPHKFPPTATNPLGEFDASKIGTGEGAQAYGHGIYTAESKEVGAEYAKVLASPRNRVMDKRGVYIEPSPMGDGMWRLGKSSETGRMIGTTGDATQGITDYQFPNVAAAVRYAKKNGFLSKDEKPLLTEIASERNYNPVRSASQMEDSTYNQLIASDPGYLYKVNLPDEQIAKMLDWDKPFSEQAPNVQAALKSIVESEYTPKLAQSLNVLSKNPLSHSLGTLNDQLGGQNITATYLQQAGIPGIKYLDEGSRGVGKGTRNFVTFPGEEKNLTILERNGQPSALKAKETFAGFATPEQYNAAKFYGQNQTERWPAAWAKSGAVTPEEILSQKGIVQPPPTQRDKDLYLLESRFSGFMDASKARQFLENNMLKATKKEKDLLKKYYDASGRFIPREELPVQQQNSLNSFMR